MNRIALQVFAARDHAGEILCDEEWLRIREQDGAIELALYAAQDAWDLLEIDWDLYHRDSRTVLDDPFFWDPADDCAPHGNDTGADLLENYLAWEKRNRSKSPVLFLERELKSRWNTSLTKMKQKLESLAPTA